MPQWATSTDGLTWTTRGVALESRNVTFKGSVQGPELVRWDDGKIRALARLDDQIAIAAARTLAPAGFVQYAELEPPIRSRSETIRPLIGRKPHARFGDRIPDTA